jgi:hypothetical protein
MTSELLIRNLQSDTQNILLKAEALKATDKTDLQWRPHESSWNTLECLEHLRLYGAYYLPEIERAILRSATTSEPAFKTGVIGNYFSRMMLPEGKLNSMKTFKDKNPLNADIEVSVIDDFIQQQLTLIDLLDRSRSVSLNRVRVSTSLSRFIALRLGDTFQFIVNHHIRHFRQIERIQLAMKHA